MNRIDEQNMQRPRPICSSGRVVRSASGERTRKGSSASVVKNWRMAAISIG